MEFEYISKIKELIDTIEKEESKNMESCINLF